MDSYDDDHKRIDGFRDRYRRIKRCRQVKRIDGFRDRYRRIKRCRQVKRIDGFRDRYRRIKRCRQVKRMAAGDVLLGFTIPPAWLRDR
jgi:hypothetical protein